MQKKSVVRIVISRMIGFVIFLILLALANYLSIYIHGAFYQDIVSFFIASLLLIFLMAFFGMLSEVFWVLPLPFKVVAPIISAVSSLFIVEFIYNFWKFFDDYMKTNILIPINQIYSLVFALVIIIGYIKLIVMIKASEKSKEKIEEAKKSEKKPKKKESEIEWSDIGKEFKLAFYEMGRSLRRFFEPKKK